MAGTALDLARLISESVQTIDRACKEHDTSIPDLDKPFDPSAEAFCALPGVGKALNTAVAAADQLVATLRLAPLSALLYSGGFVNSASLRVAFEGNVASILTDAGAEGMHVDDIAAKAGVDAPKLVRYLRFLATFHIFREVRPDVFANNRISSVLELGKPLAEIRANPVNKYEGTTGIQAFLGHVLDEGHKSSSCTWETLSDPRTACSGAPEHAAFSKWVGRELSYWDWLELPERRKEMARFGVAMRALQGSVVPDAIFHGFDFNSLTEKDLIVDVGGGIGNAMLLIARSNPDVRIVLQDRAAVIDDAREHWEREFPEALKSGRVLTGTPPKSHDFFLPQPVKEASVFLLRWILHDWSTDYVHRILANLRAASGEKTRLIVIDALLPYACRVPEGGVPSWEQEGVGEGMTEAEAPEPLLANWGIVRAHSYLGDLHMNSLLNAQERTFPDLCKVLEGAGWRIERVFPDRTYFYPQVVAVPI
ncbi:O-methyltransferase [Dacryopinax primogenitus]|uniref:O-methyltransferase n=1 Tax=Dacryopinax primogenitus (strain DJM 731) TaxID=1858805 RepID=M5FZE8_DACPD|nr:O-methyltransferase [Dacryopinax primogenitus]EJT96877.1 O-methyltransferase [Dacryopinax primogenitus]